MDPVALSDSYVGLNVGGKIYQTSRATLSRYADTFFAPIMDDKIPSAKDKQGNFMIDRDGEIFRHVLNFLRNGELILPEGYNEIKLLEMEADFYLLQELKDALRTKRREMEEPPKPDMVGFSFKGSIYKLELQHVLRERNSLFYKWLSGEILLPVDPQGNFIVEKDGDEYMFLNILKYLHKGFIAKDYTEEEVARLKTAAMFYELKLLEYHLLSSHAVLPYGRGSILHVYYYIDQNFGSLTQGAECSNSFCFDNQMEQRWKPPTTHANGPGCIAYLRTSPYCDSVLDLPALQGNGNGFECEKWRCCVVDLNKINDKESETTSLEDAISYFKRIFEQHRDANIFREEDWITPKQIHEKCTLFGFQLRSQVPEFSLH